MKNLNSQVNTLNSHLNTIKNNVAIIELNPDGTILDANEDFPKIVNYSHDELIKQPYSLLCSTSLTSSND